MASSKLSNKPRITAGMYPTGTTTASRQISFERIIWILLTPWLHIPNPRSALSRTCRHGLFLIGGEIRACEELCELTVDSEPK